MIVLNGQLLTDTEYREWCVTRKLAAAQFRQYADHPDGELEVDPAEQECGICSERSASQLRAHSTEGETVTICRRCLVKVDLLLSTAPYDPPAKA